MGDSNAKPRDIDWLWFIDMDEAAAVWWIRKAKLSQLRTVVADQLWHGDYDAFMDDAKGTAKALIDIYINGYDGTPVMRMNARACRDQLRELWKEYRAETNPPVQEGACTE